ncbi:MAG: hypothetical protein JW860_00205 [Sedimentisphaerales bacterium]|nr:hypothetical protein [Sedimentisphaerales bacterium]
MSKWYRISLSLAAKCRLGFAFAVLLIISAGLYLPYKWMDKLVEQGKTELAQAEVEHVLRSHFKIGVPRKGVTVLPSLASGSERVMAESGTAFGQPETDWLNLQALGLASTDSDGGRDSLKELIPEDAFLRRAVRRFVKDKDLAEIFELQIETAVDDDAVRLSEDESIWDYFHGFLPWDQPTRYLRAVRADVSCMASGCHVTRASSGVVGEVEESKPLLPASFGENELIGVISVTIPAGQTSATLLFNRIFIVVGGLVSGILAIVLFYLITQRFILQPVRFLREAADNVGAAVGENQDQGEPDPASWQKALDITEKIKTGDEYEEMAQAFHQMLQRLKLAQDRLRETNRALDLRLGELEERNVSLYESNKLKSEFLANVSHELRTPLNAILGFADILKEQAQVREDEKNIRYVNNVLQSGHHLLRIINELLELAKIEAGKVQVNWEKCSIHSILEVLINLTRPLYEGKKLELKLNIADDLPLIETDPAKFQQILFNVLDNAIKFTPEQGRIDINAYLLEHDTLGTGDSGSDEMASYESMEVNGEGEQLVRITLSDTGPGILPEDRDKIFDKFLQLDGSVTREHAGTGLGLAIVKELAQILGISIAVTSNIPHGTTFTLTVPTHTAVMKMG